jgi:hypothetical protein
VRQWLVLEGGADFVDVGAVGADGFVELVPGHVELFGPVGDVGGHFGIDLLGVVGAFGVLLVGSVGLVLFGLLLVLDDLVARHGFPLECF